MSDSKKYITISWSGKNCRKPPVEAFLECRLYSTPLTPAMSCLYVAEMKMAHSFANRAQKVDMPAVGNTCRPGCSVGTQVGTQVGIIDPFWGGQQTDTQQNKLANLSALGATPTTALLPNPRPSRFISFLNRDISCEDDN